MKKLRFYCSVLLFTIITTPLFSKVSSLSNEKLHQIKNDTLVTRQTVGISIDLLPPIMSLVAGEVGYSAQIWYGYNKFRVRGVLANFYLPDKIMGNKNFSRLKTDAKAVIFDYFLKKDFKGWWIGSGFELWNNQIESKSSLDRFKFKDYVVTLGGGYIFKVYKNFYIEPWGAIHYVVNNEKIISGETQYNTKRFQGEISLKIGWHL